MYCPCTEKLSILVITLMLNCLNHTPIFTLSNSQSQYLYNGICISTNFCVIMATHVVHALSLLPTKKKVGHTASACIWSVLPHTPISCFTHILFIHYHIYSTNQRTSEKVGWVCSLLDLGPTNHNHWSSGLHCLLEIQLILGCHLSDSIN